MKYIYCVFLFFSALSLRAQSTDYDKWISKAMQFVETNQLDSASLALNNAMASDPTNKNNSVLLLNQGIIQRQLQMYNEAYISFTAALSNTENAPLVLHNRASLLVEMERFDDALEDYNALLQIDSSDTEALYRRGLLYLQQGNRAQAETDFASAERVAPNDLFTKLSRALLLKLDNDWQNAEMIYSEIIASEIYEANSIYYLNRAECYLNTGQTAKAAADIRAIERDEKANPFFYILRGRLRLEQFDKFAAKIDFEKAKQLGYDADIANDWIKKANTN